MRKIILFIGMYAFALYSTAQLQAPVLNTPADSAAVVRVNVKLIWGPSLGGLVFGYEVEVDKSNLFTNPISNFPVNGTAAQTKELEFNTRYFWRVRAKGANSTFSPWSVVRSFTTFNNEFSGLSPIGGNKNPKVGVTWDTIAGVDTYHYEFAEDAGFTSPILGSVSHPNNSVITGELKFNQDYFYRIWAEHGTDISAKSATSTFKTRNSIDLISPDTMAIGRHPASELKCRNTAGVSSYRFEIDNGSNFDTSSLEYVQATILDSEFDDPDHIVFTTSRLLYGTQYFWRAQALNNTGKSAWSEVRSFTTIDKVTLTSPADDEKNVPKRATLSWRQIDGTETYEIEIDTDPTFSTSPKSYTTKNDTSTSISITFTDWIKYYWRVRSITTKDESGWSDAWSFTIHPVGIDESDQVSFMLSPNPAQDMIQLQMNSIEFGTIHIEFYNTLGSIVSSQSVSGNSSNDAITVDVSDLKPGVYMMAVKTNNGQATQRLIIQ